METAIFYITLDIDDAYSHVSMNLHQGESGRKISASFSQSSKPYPISEDCHAVFAGTVPDGQVFFNDCVIENECVICELPAQITSLFGLVKAEIRLYGDKGNLVASPAFTINVVESAMEDGALLERIEVTALTDLIGQAKEAVAECKSSVIDEVELSYQENGGEASVHAQLEENEDGRTLQLHFSNLKGEVGEQGLRGDKGDKGDKGETGDIGPAGKDGVDCTPLALGAYVTHTAAGDIASFDDGADGIPVKELVVNIEPVQDLNGYDSPWPPGGGKNILAPWFTTQTFHGVTWTVNEDGTFTASGTAVESSQLISSSLSLPTGEYILSGCPSGGSETTYYLRVLRYNGSTLIDVATDYGEGQNFTVTGEETDIKVFVSVNGGVTAPSGTWKPMIRLATETDASYSPYSNICPISGWTGAKVGVQSASEAPVLIEPVQSGSGDPSPTNIRPISGWELPQAGTVYGGRLDVANGVLTVDRAMLTYNTANMTGSDEYPGWVDSRLSTIAGPNLNRGYTTYLNVGKIVGVNTLSVGNEKIILVKSVYGKTLAEWVALALDVQIILPLYTPITYQLTPIEVTQALQALDYNGSQYVIDFPDEAGTVYGGTLDVTSGVLTVDRAKIVADGVNVEVIGKYGLDEMAIAGIYMGGTISSQSSILLSSYLANKEPATADDNRIFSSSGYIFLGIKGFKGYGTGLEYSTRGEFLLAVNTYLKSNPLEIVYPLATPITYQLTPTEVTTILGVNNVYADTGDSTVTYRADPTLIYNKLTAAIISSGA